MGRVEANNEGETSQAESGTEPAASQPQQFQGVQSVYQSPSHLTIGAPWSTGLFDCHLDQTNGKLSLLLSLLSVLFVWDELVGLLLNVLGESELAFEVE